MRVALVVALVASAALAAGRVYNRGCDVQSRRSDRGGVACSNYVDGGVLDLNGYPIPLALQCPNDAGTIISSQAPIPIPLVDARASSAYCTLSDGTGVLVPNNVLRRERIGVLMEPASSNQLDARYDAGTGAARDLASSEWV